MVIIALDISAINAYKDSMDYGAATLFLREFGYERLADQI
jgi:hypothetical protein